MRTPIAAAVAALFVTAPALAADATLSEVVVPGSHEAALTQADPQPWAHSQVSREGVTVLGGPAQSNPNRLLDLMPSVNVESADGYGLSATRNLNLRGKGDFHMTRNVEGLPLTGTGHGAADMFDLENVADFELYRGAMPAGAGLGVSNTTGATNMTLRRPEDKFGVEFRQSFGTENFRRTFTRVDSGRIGPSGTSFFVSASDMQADKWKGAGLSGDRSNFTFGLSQPFANGAKFELFALSNHNEAHTYRAMNYAQMQNRDSWRTWDYDTTLNPAAGQRQNWYGFNRVVQDDKALIANVVLPVGNDGRITFRPYYWKNDGYTLSANGNNVRRWDIVHEAKGFTAQYDLKISSALDLTAGYWWMDMESPPPPVYQKDYAPTASGDLVWSKWAVLSKHGEHQFRSPFLQLTGRAGGTTLSGGVRLHQQVQPSFSYYQTAGLPDVPYDAVWANNPAIDPWQQVAAKTFREWLPNLSLRHELRHELALTAPPRSRRLGTGGVDLQQQPRCLCRQGRHPAAGLCGAAAGNLRQLRPRPALRRRSPFARAESVLQPLARQGGQPLRSAGERQLLPERRARHRHGRRAGGELPLRRRPVGDLRTVVQPLLVRRRHSGHERRRDPGRRQAGSELGARPGQVRPRLEA